MFYSFFNKFEYNKGISFKGERKMTAVLYVLIAVLVFFIVGYFLARIGCTSGERYVSETPTDPVTEDSGSCEDPEILANQKKRREAAEAEAQRIQAEAAKEETVKKEADEKIRAEEEAAKREAEEKSAAEKAAAAKEDEEVQAEAGEKAEAVEAAVQKETQAKDSASPDGEFPGSSSPSEPETAEVSAPEGLLDAPRDGGKDNLTRIKGIGIKIDEALNSIGIWHFDQIAVWTEENMAWADKELAFPGRAKRDDWVGQAKLLAEGKETEFSKRVDKGEVASSKKV